MFWTSFSLINIELQKAGDAQEFIARITTFISSEIDDDQVDDEQIDDDQKFEIVPLNGVGVGGIACAMRHMKLRSVIHLLRE